MIEEKFGKENVLVKFGFLLRAFGALVLSVTVPYVSFTSVVHFTISMEIYTSDVVTYIIFL